MRTPKLSPPTCERDVLRTWVRVRPVGHEPEKWHLAREDGSVTCLSYRSGLFELRVDQYTGWSAPDGAVCRTCLRRYEKLRLHYGLPDLAKDLDRAGVIIA